MEPLAIRAYVAAAALLLAKYLAVTSVQAKVRFSSRTFRWPEDAAKWQGVAAPNSEDETVGRGQAVLRNDGETQPLFLAISAAWVALGAPGAFALVALPGYALARCAHAWFFLRPRQPARNRAFVIAQLTLFAVTLDAIRLSMKLD